MRVANLIIRLAHIKAAWLLNIKKNIPYILVIIAWKVILQIYYKYTYKYKVKIYLPQRQDQ